MFGLSGKHLGVKVNYDRDTQMTEQAVKLLKDYYCRDDEESPQKAFARAAVAYCDGDMKLAQRIYDAGMVHVLIPNTIKRAVEGRES